MLLICTSTWSLAQAQRHAHSRATRKEQRHAHSRTPHAITHTLDNLCANMCANMCANVRVESQSFIPRLTDANLIVRRYGRVGKGSWVCLFRCFRCILQRCLFGRMTKGCFRRTLNRSLLNRSFHSVLNLHFLFISLPSKFSFPLPSLRPDIPKSLMESSKWGGYPKNTLNSSSVLVNSCNLKLYVTKISPIEEIGINNWFFWFLWDDQRTKQNGTIWRQKD